MEVKHTSGNSATIFVKQLLSFHLSGHGEDLSREEAEKEGLELIRFIAVVIKK